MHRVWLVAGAVSAFASLAFAAWVSHKLEGEFVPFIRITLDTAREIQFVHALAMIAVGILSLQPGRHLFLHLAGAAFLAGSVLFCGALYVSVDPTGQGDALKPLIPIGGILLFAGWTLFAIGALALKRPAAN